MLTLTHISKTYGNSKVKAVDDLSLEIKPGQIIGFIGPNGAGKTTTIKMITGILSPDTGTITVGGYDIVKEPLQAKKTFGYVPDSPDMFLRLKGMEYLNFMGDMYEVDPGERGERITHMADAFEMTGALNARIQTYSHGMRQKIIIMGVLLHRPSVWILDEPLTGLDPKSSFQLKEMMRQHADAGNTVFFSTHVLEVAEKLCDKVAIINKGRIIFFGTLEELQAKHKPGLSLEEIFLALTNTDVSGERERSAHA
jgi:ABC-2 type transport system ATP-binding protein